jgi:hypothetical protein
MRVRILNAFDRKQIETGWPSAEWMIAALEARAFIAAEEGKPGIAKATLRSAALWRARQRGEI